MNWILFLHAPASPPARTHARTHALYLSPGCNAPSLQRAYIRMSPFSRIRSAMSHSSLTYHDVPFAVATKAIAQWHVHWSQATSTSVSTWMGDRQGRLSAVNLMFVDRPSIYSRHRGDTDVKLIKPCRTISPTDFHGSGFHIDCNHRESWVHACNTFKATPV